MPTPLDAMLGLVVASIGLLTFVIAFNIGEPRKRLTSYAVAGLVTLAGTFYYLSSELRGYNMRRRINDIQQRQQVNFDEIQKRLRDKDAPAAPEGPSKR